MRLCYHGAVSRSIPERASRWLAFAWLVLFAAHAFRTAALFPSWGSLFDSEPIVSYDHPFHVYHAEMGRNFFREAGTTWGYDPYFFAGYPKSPVWDGSVNMLEHVAIAVDIVARGLFGIDVPVALVEKWFLAVLLVASFFALRHAWTNLGLSPEEALLAEVFALFCLWFHRSPHLLSFGMLGFWAATYLGFWLVSLVACYTGATGSTTRRKLNAGRLLFLAGPLVLLGHIGGPLPIILPLLVLYLGGFRRLPAGAHAVLLGAAAWTVVANLGWLLNFVRFLPIGTDTGTLLRSQGVFEIFSAQWAKSGYVMGTVYAGLRFAVFGVATVGLACWWRRSSIVASAFAVAMAGLFTLVHYGSEIPLLSETQPQRFLQAYMLVQSPAVAIVVASLPGWAASLGPRFVGVLRIAVPGVVLGAFLTGTVLVSVVGMRLSGVPRLTGITDEGRDFIDLLRRELGPDKGPGRVLFEAFPTKMLRGHFLNLLPGVTGREFIGSPVPLPFIRYKTPSYEPGSPFGMDVRSMPAPRIVDLASAYGCQWVVCGNEDSLVFWNGQSAAAVRLGSVGGFTLFRLVQPASMFASGSGEVRAGPNEILVSALRSGPDGEAILRYHYLPTLATDPPCRIEEVRVVPEDPVGFIKLIDPPAEVRIYNDYRWRGPLVP